MKTAALAKIKTFERSLEKHNDLIAEIEKAIDDAIEECKTYVVIKKPIPYPVEKMLIEHGYIIRMVVGGLKEIIWE